MPMTKVDFIYDPDNWEVTYHWSDRSELTDDMWLGFDEIKRFGTLIEGPPKFCVRVILTRDEYGDVDEEKYQWFDTEEEAKLAIANNAHP